MTDSLCTVEPIQTLYIGPKAFVRYSEVSLAEEFMEKCPLNCRYLLLRGVC